MLTEQKTVKSVQILPEQNAVNVQWSLKVLRDGEVISERYERKAYSQEQSVEFLAEVENAQAYMDALDW